MLDALPMLVAFAPVAFIFVTPATVVAPVIFVAPFIATVLFVIVVVVAFVTILSVASILIVLEPSGPDLNKVVVVALISILPVVVFKSIFVFALTTNSPTVVPIEVNKKSPAVNSMFAVLAVE